jgi:hypothetical protein
MDTRTDEEKIRDAEAILRVLQDIRKDYEPDIDDIIKYVNHGRRTITDTQKGKRTGQDVYDGSVISAKNMLRDGICGYSISKSYRWFNYALPGKLNFPRTSGMRAWTGKRMDEYPEVKMWLEDCEEVMYSAFLRSNFYDVVPEIVDDAITIGTVHILIEEDLGRSRTVFTIPHFREVYIAEDRFGTVDTHYRVYNLSLRQLMEKFGFDKMEEVDQNFKMQLEKNPHQEKEILHAIYPRKDYNQGKLDTKNKPIVSFWMLRSGKKKFLDESGYDESPIITWRWRKNNDEIYGRSPSWDSMVDILKANQQARTNLRAAHQMVEPAMIAPEDMRGQVNKAPGAWTFTSNTKINKDFPRRLFDIPGLPFAKDELERTDKIIREHYHVDFFLMLSQAAANKVEMTATQVVEMGGEKAAILGTRIGRMETEGVNPIHDRSFAIEVRAGRIPEPPQVLMDFGGGKIEVDYLGPLAQAQKRIFKVQSMRAGIQTVTEMSQVWPESRFAINPIKTTQDMLDAYGFPQKDFNTEDEISEILTRKQQQEDAQRAVQEGVEIAKAGSRLTKKPEEGSPIDALMNPGGMT